jgi:uncharacterized protein
MSSTVTVGRSAIGRGVFAAQHLQPGQTILGFEGRVLTTPETIALGPDRIFALQVGTTEFVDLMPPARYLNHSCDPNAGIVRDRVLIALRPIAPGEEIRLDYSTAMREDHWTMECRCGEYLCRRVVLAFQHLPPITQNRYLQLGIVQHCIVSEMRRRSPARRLPPARQRQGYRRVIA